jgi:hypothetical protein
MSESFGWIVIPDKGPSATAPRELATSSVIRPKLVWATSTNRINEMRRKSAGARFRFLPVEFLLGIGELR